MKKFFNPTSHGVVDYLMVAIFAAAPSVLKLEPSGTKVSYALAVIHLLMTLVTAFPLGVFKKFAFSYHGVIECYVGMLLMIVSLIWFRNVDRMFFAVAGLVIFLTFMMTDYFDMPMPAQTETVT